MKMRPRNSLKGDTSLKQYKKQRRKSIRRTNRHVKRRKNIL